MPVERRKVFISWSKSPTDLIASALARFLKHMFDNVSPFVSKDNVSFGSLSIGEIHRQLAGTSFGILIVTRANQAEPWLNFEAGSLAKTIPDDSDARVVPLLIDHESLAQLTGPISNLQSVIADEVGVRRLLSELADVLDVDSAVFESRWATGWARFEEVLQEARDKIGQGPAAPDRTSEDMLEEIVTLLRGRSATSPFPVDRSPISRARETRLAADIFNALADGPGRPQSLDLGHITGEPPTLELYFSEPPTKVQLVRIRRKLREIAPEYEFVIKHNSSVAPDSA